MMKNNTKLIMETWRRFLKEGTEGIDENGMVIEVTEEDDPSSLPAVADADLEGDIKTIDSMRNQNNQPFEDEYNPDGDMDNLDAWNPRAEASPIPPNDGDGFEDDYNTNDPTGDRYYDEFGRPENPGDDTLIPTTDPDDSYDM